VPPLADPGHVYHLFVVRSSSRGGGPDRRNLLQHHLKEHGIDTLVHYPVSMTRPPAFQTTRPADCPRAVEACDEVLSLPLHPRLTDDEVNEVAGAVRRFH
jgi:dTDP-4-amino-4,6-dideoxygalactose transaminase